MTVSASPSLSPSKSPSASPSLSPSASPSLSPSASPSVSPSYAPAFVVTHLVHDRGNTIKLVKITLSKYATNGIPITAGECGLRRLRALIVSGSAAGYPTWWDQVNGTLHIYSAVGIPMSNEATTVSGVVLYALAVGY